MLRQLELAIKVVHELLVLNLTAVFPYQLLERCLYGNPSNKVFNFKAISVGLVTIVAPFGEKLFF